MHNDLHAVEHTRFSDDFSSKRKTAPRLTEAPLMKYIGIPTISTKQQTYLC